MNVDCALLCDAATVREGLLHILGGGVTRISRPEFPAQLGVQVALRIVIHPTESGTQHSARMVLQNEDGATVGELGFEFAIDQQGLSLVPGELISLPIAVPVQQLSLPRPGGYSFEILIDNNHQVSMPFFAVEEQAPADQPGGPS